MYFCMGVGLTFPDAKCKMTTELENVMLEAAKSYLKSLSDEQFLALTCDLSNLHDGIIRVVYYQVLIRQFRAPNRVTADVFYLSKKQIGRVLKKK